jgi:radical SAM superfamily enzyme YgiQ (UPF0313 family)
MRIYLADLGHNQVTISSDVYPLGVADLATYAQAFVTSPDPLDIRIFREPQDLKAAIDSASPDVLGLSSYAWNHNLARSFARYAKAKIPRVLTVLGGPHYPLTLPEMESWLRTMPEVDVASRGPTYEGERAFVNLLRRFVEVGKSIDSLRDAPIPANDWIDPRTGAFVRGEEVPRIEDLDEIPSPYLAGLMDPFLHTGYLPLLQISRGCPFTCSFCNSAVRSNSKVHAHSSENVKADLLYLAQRVKKDVAVSFADDNFGMYERDVEVADYIAFLQEKYGWPNYIRTTTGKNRGERIIQVMRKTRGAMPMTAAVQSMNPLVLKNIERSNIKLDTYAQIQAEVRAQGMQSYGELILALPGETMASFMKGIRDLMEAGVQRISAHQLMLLHGAPLANPESRARFGLKTKFRIVARNIGNYTGEPVIETEEMVSETPTLSFDDYLEVRVFHLLLTIFYYEGNYDEPFEFARQEGIHPFDLVTRMQQMLDQAPHAFRKVIAEFVQESRDELFDTPEDCIAWARQHFEGLVSGELGGNLLSKYSMLGRFFVAQEALDFLHLVLEDCLGVRSQEKREQLAAVMDYLRCVVLHAPFKESLAATPEWSGWYDAEGWVRDNYARPLSDYRFHQRYVFQTTVEPEKKNKLLTRLETYGEHPSGLGKFTRTLFARDLRRSLVRPQPAPLRLASAGD